MSIFSFHTWSQDVTQAYLQSEDKLGNIVYLKRQAEFGLKADDVFVETHVRTLESGAYWDLTMTRDLKNELGMDQSTLDIRLF